VGQACHGRQQQQFGLAARPEPKLSVPLRRPIQIPLYYTTRFNSCALPRAASGLNFARTSSRRYSSERFLREIWPGPRIPTMCELGPYSCTDTDKDQQCACPNYR
jgi:hypothetical protein